MRIVYSLFAISVLLFLSGIGFIIASARTVRDAAPAAAAAPTEPVVTMAQIMNAITLPNATIVYDAVGIIMNADGITEIEPRTDEEWTKVVNAATALVESGNLMLIDGRRIDEGDWVTITKQMMEAGQVALKAAQARDKDGVLESGVGINNTCDSCHAKYQRQ